MSLRLEMLQVARLAPNLLGESTQLAQQFVLSQHLPDGGFADRSGSSDLYYTVFGLESLIALRCDPPLEATAGYLKRFGDGAGLDLVHLACLARAWTTVARGDWRRVPAGSILRRIEQFRSHDGGYAQVAEVATGSVYAAFLALGAYEDFESPLPEPARLTKSLKSLQAADGAFSNAPGAAEGLTTSTAAAALLLRRAGEDPGSEMAQWLLARAHPQGGFVAIPQAPIPDLLSTATALHALSVFHVPLDGIRETCLDFVDSLWTSHGGFYGSWADDKIDCEYTYYGLLSLGHLSL